MQSTPKSDSKDIANDIGKPEARERAKKKAGRTKRGMMERTPLDYAQPTHPAEAAALHVPDYEAGRPKGVPNPLFWLILFLSAAGYFVILPAVLRWLG